MPLASTIVSWVGAVFPVMVNGLPSPHALLMVALETSNPTGNESVKATPVKAVLTFGFVIVKLRLVVFPVRTYVEPKTLEITGGSMTVRLADP